MASAIIAGVFTLAGVIVGVLLEPIKAATAHRARQRQDRADRCVQLLEAAMVSRTWLVTQNRYYRDRDAGRRPPEEVLQQSQEHLGKSREAIRKTTILLRMSGPETLSGAAQAVRDAERALRELRHSPDDAQSSDPDGMPATVGEARDKLDVVITKFADVARKYC